jgi:hypothetical protein
MVTLHLAMGMLDQAGQYKHALEEAERAKTKARAAANHTWMPEYFNERSPHMIRDRKVMEKLYQEAVWDNATVEISLPVVTREPISMDDE